MSLENCCTDHRAVIAAAPPHCEEDADQHHHGGNVENVECELSDRLPRGKLPSGMPKTKAR